LGERVQASISFCAEKAPAGVKRDASALLAPQSHLGRNVTFGLV
jgi:hypothetical protein